MWQKFCVEDKKSKINKATGIAFFTLLTSLGKFFIYFIITRIAICARGEGGFLWQSLDKR